VQVVVVPWETYMASFDVAVEAESDDADDADEGPAKKKAKTIDSSVL
jgi:hypothetical protein